MSPSTLRYVGAWTYQSIPNIRKSLQKKAKGSVELNPKLAYYRVTVELVAGLALGLFFECQPTHAYRILEEIDYRNSPVQESS